MRGPLLSGPLGSATTLDAVAKSLGAAASVVVIGPLWLGEVLSTRVRVLLLAEPEEKPRARRAARRTAAAGQRLTVATAGVDLPLALGGVEALLVESASTLDAEAISRWMATLVPVLRPGGRLMALDATDDPAVEARLAGVFLASALGHIVQDRPREGVVLTVGTAPPATVISARYLLGGGAEPVAVSTAIVPD
ncbi:MAG: hypothetical protein ABI560_01715 [Myxococcales bacterium]